MNDQVDFVAQKRVFALLRECSDAANLLKTRPPILIAKRTNEDHPHLGGRLGATNKLGDVIGLPAGQITSPGTEPNFHDRTSCFLSIMCGVTLKGSFRRQEPKPPDQIPPLSDCLHGVCREPVYSSWLADIPMDQQRLLRAGCSRWSFDDSGDDLSAFIR
jgi:hypothetical protein